MINQLFIINPPRHNSGITQASLNIVLYLTIKGSVQAWIIHCSLKYILIKINPGLDRATKI